LRHVCSMPVLATGRRSRSALITKLVTQYMVELFPAYSLNSFDIPSNSFN
jgi:hypothetical protein